MFRCLPGVATAPHLAGADAVPVHSILTAPDLPGVTTQNDATASYLGYIFQGQYALLALWDAMDDDASVSVETEDDVVLDGNDPRLAQLKHSTGTPTALTITNVGFWKTIRIWAAHLRVDPLIRTTDVEDRTKYLFVTVALVADGDPLNALVCDVSLTNLSRDAVLEALVAEATRVGTERSAAAAAGASLPHAERAAGCEAFLALDDAARRRLVARIEILPGSFRITDVASQVELRLQRAAAVRNAIRASVAERLIERWDRQVTLALMGRRDREIRRSELQGMVEDLIREHGPTMLPNDYGRLVPEAAEYAAAAGSLLECQIVLVDGGASRVQRAVRDRWRARNQRRRWTDDDASLVPLLKEYDDVVKEAWGDRHGPIRDECRGREEDERRRRGRELLDWAYDEAPASVRPPRPGWSDAFYVRGMLHQFADELEVGWHPDYRERLAAAPAAGPTGVPTPPEAVPEAGAAEGQVAPTLTPMAPAELRDQLPPDRAPAPARLAAGDARPRVRSRRARPITTE